MEADMLKRIGTFKKLGLIIAASSMLFLVSPPKANAGVRFGIGVGPAYVAPYAYSYPYAYNYAYPYAYGFPNSGLSFGWGGYYGHAHDYDRGYRGGDRDFHGGYHGGEAFHGGGFHADRGHGDRGHGGRR